MTLLFSHSWPVSAVWGCSRSDCREGYPCIFLELEGVFKTQRGGIFVSTHFSVFYFSGCLPSSWSFEVYRLSFMGLAPIFPLAQPRYMYQILAMNHLSSRLSGDGSSGPSTGSFVFSSLVQSVSHLHPWLLRTYLLRFHNCLIDMYLITCLIHPIKQTIQLVFI